MSTTVVNLRREEYDVYIGRPGHGEEGYFGNPVVVGQKCPECGTYHRYNGGTLACYTAYLHKRLESDPEFRTRFLQLRGQRLGCFCKPRDCHGDVMAAVLDEIE